MPEGPMVRGSDRRADIRSRPGGSAANQAVWLGRLKCWSPSSRVSARRRRDACRPISARGVDALPAGDPSLPSGVLITIVDPDGERSFLTDRGANLNLNSVELPVAHARRCEHAGRVRLLLLRAQPRAAVMAL